jgi:hypothetical protein
MSLHPDVEKKILGLGSGEAVNRGFLDLFKAVVNDCIQQNLPNGTCIMPFYDEDSGLEPGDWAAEIHFVVRQVESVNDSSSDKETDQG